MPRSRALGPAVREGVLHVCAGAASCDEDPGGAHPACHVHRQDRDVPARLNDSGTDRSRPVPAGTDTA
ncbi:hypothetical protein [Streptomyces sp. AHA2]|uniref:hypothetical protein n=1 Tax=Streptomyces sp. AHA2 TaxID=3064526 RepID=UPI003FA73480